jgi:hypothetical protein
MNARLSSVNNGLYAVPVADNAVAGWQAIDLHRVRDRSELLEAFGQALHFPAGFGANWDALADCLQDLSWIEGGILLRLQGYQAWREAAAGDAAVLEDILAESAEFWRRHSRLFVVAAEGGQLPPLPR